MKCVKDSRCIEGSCGHLVLDCRLAIQDSLVRLEITGVCDEDRICGRFCLCVSGHKSTHRNDTKTGLETQSKLISYHLF